MNRLLVSIAVDQKANKMVLRRYIDRKQYEVATFNEIPPIDAHVLRQIEDFRLDGKTTEVAA